MRSIKKEHLEKLSEQKKVIRRTRPDKKPDPPKKKDLTNEVALATTALAKVFADAVAQNKETSLQTVSAIDKSIASLLGYFERKKGKRKYRMDVKRDARGFISTVDVEEI